MYIAAIIWYCYGYITALTMARTIGTFTAHSDGFDGIHGEVKILSRVVIYNNTFSCRCIHHRSMKKRLNQVIKIRSLHHLLTHHYFIQQCNINQAFYFSANNFHSISFYTSVFKRSDLFIFLSLALSRV